MDNEIEDEVTTETRMSNSVAFFIKSLFGEESRIPEVGAACVPSMRDLTPCQTRKVPRRPPPGRRGASRGTWRGRVDGVAGFSGGAV